jgi:hypothetical protein
VPHSSALSPACPPQLLLLPTTAAAAAAAAAEALSGIVPPLEALQGKGKLKQFRKAVKEMLAAEVGLRSGKEGAGVIRLPVVKH